MRLTALATLIGAALATMTAPAMAVWRGYQPSLGFAFAAPGELRWRREPIAAMAGRTTIVYRFVDDNIEYKVVSST
jgi:hypothetical protein